MPTKYKISWSKESLVEAADSGKSAPERLQYDHLYLASGVDPIIEELRLLRELESFVRSTANATASTFASEHLAALDRHREGK